MASRSPEGAAWLVAGFGVAGAPAPDAAAVHTLGQIGEALLATGAAWQIRRLTAAPGDRHAADRATLKQQLDELAAERVRSAILVLLGSIVQVGGAPALVTGARAREYPEDATLPLAWIRERLLEARAEQLVVVVSACGEGTPGGWLEVLGTDRPQHAIAIDAPAPPAAGLAPRHPAAHPLVDALLGGLCGDALDPRTGTVTMASLSEHLAARAPRAALQAAAAPETLVQPPPLGGFWGVRSRPAELAAGAAGATEAAEDLTGCVLPGGFRIDGLLARGTFGAVYRARQLTVERDVAVKVLHADIDPASADGRLFVQEIRSVGRIKHASVVPIYQADVTADRRLFFVMELLEGRDLQALGAGGPLPRERAVELVRQLLAGLGAAHDAGLIHADVKPANAIVVPADGRPPHGAGAGPGPGGDGAEPDDAAAAERLVLVDFGLSRLRERDRPVQSAGGTLAYMAPEQLREGRVDARSDLYSAALVLLFLLTGWQRKSAAMLAPPLDGLRGLRGPRGPRGLRSPGDPDGPGDPGGPSRPDGLLRPLGLLDPALRAVLSRALDPDPARRFQTARSLAAALAGRTGPRPSIPPPLPVPPFRHLTPFTEADRGRLHGREADLALLTEHALFRRSVIYTAPSGTGKTSLLRAGLVPRLEALGARAIYQACRGQPLRALASVIAAGGAAASVAPGGAAASVAGGDAAASIDDAIAAFREQRGGKLVLVIDQIEAALGDPALLPAVLGFERWPADADVTVVLGVREDHLGRLLDRTQELEPGMPIVRLPPLRREGARAAILGPLTECRLAIEPELLDALLDDLQRAAAALGPGMGWGDAPAVYPPHLQLACTVLFEQLGPGQATLTLAGYRALGGFDAIVGEYLERVLGTELDRGRDAVARDLFLELVTADHERALRPEGELVFAAGARHGAAPVAAVLEVLRSRGLLVRVRGADEPAWELAHDSLIPRVLAWIDARDLARRRAIELVRHHLRRSRPGHPSLLDRAELRELRAHPGVLPELAAQWQERGAAGGWTPERLVARSRRVLRRRAVLLGGTVAAAVLAGGLARSCAHSRRAAEERARALANLGELRLVIEAFDWDARAQRATAAPTPEGWRWELRDRTSEDASPPDLAGPPLPAGLVLRRGVQRAGPAATEDVDVRGGPASLVVERPGCAASILPLQLPGYSPEHARATLSLRIPTCAASAQDMIAVPAGPFVHAGAGEPTARLVAELLEQRERDPEVAESVTERVIDEPAFSIDRTEVTNAAFEVFAELAAFTRIRRPDYPATSALGGAAGPRHPVSYLTFDEARAYCRFLGKELPTSRQWGKALRGGLTLPGGAPNPAPRRNLPWIQWRQPVPAQIMLSEKTPAPGTAEVGAHPDDRSPYGILDLAGNVEEWTSTPLQPGVHAVRGGNWAQTDAATLVDVMAIENIRTDRTQNFSLGVRCASREPPAGAAR